MALNFPSNPTNGQTYQSGSSATYLYNGTHWFIPSGQSGTSGTSGAQGPQGNQGVQGTTGSIGPQGINGTAGSSGVQGPQGNQGASGTSGTNGAAGTSGAQGPQGNQGPAGSGAQGVQGPTGGTGPQGNQGTQGPQGNQGTQGTTFNINQYSGSVFVTGSLTVSSAIIVSSSMVANTSSLYLTSGSNLYVQNNGLVEITGSLTISGSNNINLVSPVLQIGTGSGDEGGEILLAKSQTNNSLTGSGITIDSYQNRLRVFEQGGDARGVYIDLAKTPTGVAGELTWKSSGLVNAGTFVTLDNIKATVTTTGNRGLSVAAVTSNFSTLIGGNYATSGGANGTSGTLSITTSASTSVFNWNFTGAGDISTYIITDTTNSRGYRIVLQIGSSYNNNLIIIERLY